MEGYLQKILRSWNDREGNVNKTEDLLQWIETLNATTHVSVRECSINESSFWFYDDYSGEVLNRKRSFFSVKGMRMFENDEFVKEQPIILQPEIGYLGIICQEIDGVLNFLMQAKIEPGNINCVQISPTIQATKSNFTRAHGGKYPAYLEYFERSSRYDVLYDQIQSEQAARFYKKRNRNMIMAVSDPVEVLPNFKWMTLGQIKRLMEIDNLVNMDTRTVLSGIPLVGRRIGDEERRALREHFSDPALFRSAFDTDFIPSVTQIYQKINRHKMFREVSVLPVPLSRLLDWKVDEYGIVCKKDADFMVRYYDIEIAGREVQKWIQPLFKATGRATFGLLTKTECGVRKYLVRVKSEIGLFDQVELGPSVQREATHGASDDAVERVFWKHLNANDGVVTDVLLSEEGGRFYHEENRNAIIEIGEGELPELPEDCLWVEYGALNYLVQINNCLNIQLRNLLSLIRL